MSFAFKGIRVFPQHLQDLIPVTKKESSTGACFYLLLNLPSVTWFSA